MKCLNYILLLFYGSILAQGGTQAPSPEECLSKLTKEQLIEVIQVLSTMQQQKAVAVPVAPMVITTPLPMPPPTTAAAECAHFVLDMIGQVVTVAIAQDPIVTVNGVTNIVHNLISLVVQQHQNQKRSLAIIDEEIDEEEFSRYELLNRVLAELEELMEELRDIDIAIQEIQNDF